MKLKKLIPLALSFTLLSAQAFAADNAGVIVNGNALQEDAYIIDGRVYVPLRAAGEALGATVSWDNDTKTASLERGDDDSAISAINTASESVVAIVGRYKSKYMSSVAQDYNELYAHGAGVIIKSNGTILTNAHVVDEIDNITVIFANGDSYGAAVLYSDSESDLAVVKINKLGLKPITFAEENSLVVGQSVIAIGTPLSLSMINSASKGIVSGTGVNIGQQYLFTQSDVAINGGNSGGPLINLAGQLVGINSIKYTGTNIEGMSFSIPVDTINYVISSFEVYGRVLRPNIGVTLTESWESKLGLPTKKGLGVSSSQNPLLLPGDSVTKVNGIEVHSIADYNEALKKTYTGGAVSVTYLRSNAEGTVEIEPLSN